MYKLGTTGLKWLKTLHLVAVSCWVGGAIALLLLFFLKNGVMDGGALYGINQSIHFVDLKVVVIPGAFGCLLTGLAYGIFTRWGFFKQGWMIFKWVVTIGAILFGTFFLGPWETKMLEISAKLGLAALDNPMYLHNQFMHAIFGAVQTLVLILTLGVSIFKPWKNLRK